MIIPDTKLSTRVYFLSRCTPYTVTSIPLWTKSNTVIFSSIIVIVVFNLQVNHIYAFGTNYLLHSMDALTF